jgi:hypothetical protein
VIRVPFFSCLVFLAIAACGSRGPVDAQAKATIGLPNVSLPAPTAIGEPHGPTSPAKAEPPPAAKIPEALRGRWALAPRDCTATAKRAKSLLDVTADDLDFYESHAVPAAEIETDSGSISGTFAFSGLGRSWNKYEALTVNQQRLTRTETNPSASFSYAKCT